MVGLISFQLRIPDCHSLKEKRRRIKPLMVRLRRQFNVSVAEMDLQDQWQETILACAMIGNERRHLESALRTISTWIEDNWPDGDVIDQKVEFF